MGLTDIEMAHGLEYDDAYFEERPYEIEYEVIDFTKLVVRYLVLEENKPKH